MDAKSRQIRLPNDQQRILISGATGSGKTLAALHQFSLRNYTEKPWVIYDFKYDENINGIINAQHLDARSEIPSKPGIYIVHPIPQRDDNAVEDQLWQIWEQENVGIYIDEGYMINRNSDALSALLTQGRSKHIPMITLTQRPVWLNSFILSESEFYQVFRLQRVQDVKKMADVVPADMSERLPEYHSYYYDVGRNQMNVLPPGPDAFAILDTINTRMKGATKVV